MENQLEVIVKESHLEPTKAKYILDNFKDYFQLASEWEIKARGIVVTSADQTADMEMARVGRLFLREKRIAIENSRKKIKEEAIREGKAIDGIANVLKALIVPIEEYLDKQEHFVEIEQEKKEAAIRLEIEQRIEAERIAKEKAEAEEREKMRIENERLRKEASEKEAALKIERQKAEEQRRKQDAVLAKERQKADEARQRAESEKRAQEKLIADQKAKAEEEKKKAADLARKKLEAERKEKERLEELLKDMIVCPKCSHKFELCQK